MVRGVGLASSTGWNQNKVLVQLWLHS